MKPTQPTPALCHVLHTLDVGGAELLARDFALRSREHIRIVFACLDDLGSMGPELKAAGFEVRVFDRRPGFDHGCLRRMARFFSEQNVRLVHAHQYAPFFYSSLSRSFGPRFPIVFTEHGRDYPDYRRWKRVWANKLLLGRRDRVVGVGQYVRQALIDNEGLPAERVGVIYNGVATHRYDPLRPLRDQVRRELGIAPDEYAVIQVARLNRLKDHVTALRAAHQVRNQGLRFRFLIVGDGEERERLGPLIDQLGLRDTVQMLGLRQDVPRLLQAADVFLLSSITEGIPLTLIEAMLTALPCVATRVGGIPEVIVPDETGLLGEPGNPDSLASALATLQTSADLRRRMGLAGRQRACQLFDDQQMHINYQQVYEQLTGQAFGSDGNCQQTKREGAAGNPPADLITGPTGKC